MKLQNYFIKLFLFFSILFFGHTQATIFKKKPTTILPKIPIVFHPTYDISCFGLERFHPFVTNKYGLVYKELIKALHEKYFGTQTTSWLSWFFSSPSLTAIKNMFYTPEMVSYKDLCKVHSERYLKSLKNNEVLGQITELGPLLGCIPNFFNSIVEQKLLVPMRYATGGTILAAELALKNKWSINLSGGYHHAKKDHGEGFCVYADIPLAIKKLHEKDPKLKVLIVDLDAHQGNGHESICGKDPNVFIYDIYNEDIYPGNDPAKKYINYPNTPQVPSGITGKKYLAILKSTLPPAIEDCKPDIIFYNAGTDILDEDPLGGMDVPENDIIRRDLYVFKQAKKYRVPIAMVPSGGYTTKSANIIATSIKKIFELHGVL
jgi:histone deacetylase 11